jgi:long-subunit fatty acid transport protein
LTGGILWSYRDRLSIGAVYKSGSRLDIETETWAGENRLGETDTRLDYPQQFGFGIAIMPVDELLMCADYIHTPWSESEYEGVPIDDFSDVTEFSFGIEYIRDPESMSYLDRIPVRAGFSKRPWYFEQEGETISETAVSLGFGLPFRDDLGSIDVAAQYGWRGDIGRFGAEETWLRIYVGFSAGGPWIE